MGLIKSKHNTVWKLQGFSITQSIREIKIGKCRDSKSGTLTHLKALNFDFYKFLHFLKAENDKINKIQSPRKWPKRKFQSF